jgi:hypothetical protein
MVNQKFSKLTGPQTKVMANLDDAVPDLATDEVPFLQAGVTKKVNIADLVDGMAGVADTTGLTDTAGVLTVAAKIAHLVADEKSALFIETGEFDFSSAATAIDTKVIDALPAKGQLLCALISVSQATNGTTSNVISISKAAAAATKMTGDLTITIADTVYLNHVNNCLVMWPVAGANSIVASGGDVYLYAAASAGRTAGKVKYVLVFMKTA